MSHWVTRRSWGRSDEGSHSAPRPRSVNDNGELIGEFIEHRTNA
jgi:hypothetical protein